MGGGGVGTTIDWRLPGQQPLEPNPSSEQEKNLAINVEALQMRIGPNPPGTYYMYIYICIYIYIYGFRVLVFCTIVNQEPLKVV